MDKKELIKKLFDELHQSNLIFTKDSFQKSLNRSLSESGFELTENTFHSLIKELVQKDFLIQDENNLIKSRELLRHDANKQTEYLYYLIGEYSEGFDADYIHDEYTDNIVKNELTSAQYTEVIEHSYEVIKEYLLDKKFVKLNTNTNQFER